jgi:hypothetical protein
MRVEDLMELAPAARKAGLRSFVVRRILQRVERGEVSPLEAGWLKVRSRTNAHL